MRRRRSMVTRARVPSALGWVAALAGTMAATGARAQGNFASVGGPTAPPTVYTGRPDLFAKPGRGEDALPIGNWLILPSGFAGVVFATNPNNIATGGQAGAGLRLSSNTIARTDDGIKQTTLYGRSDSVFSNITNGNSGNSPNSLNMGLGMIENYRPVSDLFINLQGDLTRQASYSNGVTGSNLPTLTPISVGTALSPTLTPNNVGITPTSTPLSSTQIAGSATIQKNFADAFVILGGSIVDLTYDNSSINTAPSPNGVIYTGSGRGGFWVIPDLYTYLETSVDRRDYGANPLSSSGFRTVTGVGSDQIGLFRGELYFGYQAEKPTSPSVGSAKGPLLGGRGSYFPVPELTISASLDETIGASLVTVSPTSPAGSAAKLTTLTGQATYLFSRELRVAARGGISAATFGGNNRRDTGWTLDFSATYSVWRSFGITFDIQRSVLNSTATDAGFTNNEASVGLSYRF